LLFWESIPIKYLQTFLVVLRLIWTDWDSSVALKCEDNLMTIKHWSQMDLPKLIINFWLWWFFKVIFILKCIKMIFFYFLKFIFEISTSKRSKTKKIKINKILVPKQMCWVLRIKNNTVIKLCLAWLVIIKNSRSKI
jgi:hypothetical protein